MEPDDFERALRRAHSEIAVGERGWIWIFRQAESPKPSSTASIALDCEGLSAVLEITSSGELRTESALRDGRVERGSESLTSPSELGPRVLSFVARTEEALARLAEQDREALRHGALRRRVLIASPFIGFAACFLPWSPEAGVELVGFPVPVYMDAPDTGAGRLGWIANPAIALFSTWAIGWTIGQLRPRGTQRPNGD
jgi:hypothetical protein